MKAINDEKFYYGELSKRLTNEMGINRENNEEFFKNLFGKIKYHFIN